MKRIEKKALEIIGIAGEGRREVFKALEMAKKGKGNEAKAMMRAARGAMKEHERVEVGTGKELLMIHAQDHLMNSLIIYDIVNELIEIYLEGKIRNEV
ncbi:MAG: PTS lactose/cellobiose transporter subunit IIA [Clostridium sp.]